MSGSTSPTQSKGFLEHEELQERCEKTHEVNDLFLSQVKFGVGYLGKQPVDVGRMLPGA